MKIGAPGSPHRVGDEQVGIASIGESSWSTELALLIIVVVRAAARNHL
jgi:hypothetical protein